MVKIQNIKQLIQPKVSPLNKKTKTYLLLGAVIIIWSSIVFKFFSGYNPEVVSVEQQDLATNFKPILKKVDTFSVQEIPRDPFLGTISKKRTSSISTVTRKAKDTLQIPKMVYLGLLKKQQSKNQIFVLNIDNEQFIVKKGQVVKKVKVIQADTKKMIVSYNNKAITLPIQ